MSTRRAANPHCACDMSPGTRRPPRVGLLWRNEWDPPKSGTRPAESCKLRGVFEAFERLGVVAEPVIYADEWIAEVRETLLRLDGVLVWVNPIEQGLDRSKLDPLLCAVSDACVWVSAHPDVITRMATKRVLFDARDMTWGTDTRLYHSAAELREGLAALDGSGARVLKQQRGMGGQGVWKVELDLSDDSTLRVQEAIRGATPTRLSREAFATLCESYFERGGIMVEQPFQSRIAEGMIRAYLNHDRVVGFAHQHPAGLRPENAGAPPPGKHFETAAAPAYRRLLESLELEWIPQLQQRFDLAGQQLPVIWDADFLYGSKNARGDDTYVLCEINASSTFAFPEHAMSIVAEAALARIAERR
jgi:hypothetical protein